MTVRRDRYGGVVQASRPERTTSLAVGAASQLAPTFANNRRVVSAPKQDDGTTYTPLVQTTHVRIVSTVACWLAFGTSPVAAVRSVGSMFLPASLPEYFWVKPGEQVAVIQDNVGGFCYITELTP